MALRTFISVLLILSALDVKPVTGATTTTEAITNAFVFFKSVTHNFTTDLLNPSSLAFKKRSALVKSELTDDFQNAFPSFRTLEPLTFRNGSIITLMRLGFLSSSVPNYTQIQAVMIKAAANVTGFDIEVSSINVNGMGSSSGVTHKISLITASCLVLLSWFLSNQQ